MFLQSPKKTSPLLLGVDSCAPEGSTRAPPSASMFGVLKVDLGGSLLNHHAELAIWRTSFDLPLLFLWPAHRGGGGYNELMVKILYLGMQFLISGFGIVYRHMYIYIYSVFCWKR